MSAARAGVLSDTEEEKDDPGYFAPDVKELIDLPRVFLFAAKEVDGEVREKFKECQEW